MRLPCPNHQLLSGNLDHLFRHHPECVDIGDALNLGEEPVQQPEIALGDADDRRDRLVFGCASGVQGQPPGAPLLSEIQAGFLSREGTVTPNTPSFHPLRHYCESALKWDPVVELVELPQYTDIAAQISFAPGSRSALIGTPP